MKYLKLLTTAMIINTIITSGMVQAATTSSSQILQCTLGGYVNLISDESTATLTATIDPETGTLSTPLISKFDIQTNSDQTLYLRANIKNSGNNDELAFSKKGSDMYIVLGHIENKPSSNAILDAKAPNSTATKNKNVIAYKVTDINLTGASEKSTAIFKPEQGHYEIPAKAGLSGAITTISTAADPNTYSFLDASGTYQATVILTTSAT